MTIKVLVNGAFGQMGKEAVLAIQADPELELVGSLGRLDDLSTMIRTSGAQVVVDLTTPQVVYDNTKTIIAANAHPVIGTTGLSQEQIIVLKKQCARQRLGGVIAPNFSLAAVLMMQFAAEAAKLLPDVEIIELHHPRKIDAPSGTAIKTAEKIAAAKDSMTSFSSEKSSAARGAMHLGVPIHSVRLPGLVAHQMVLFGGLHETLTLRHDSMHRASYMPGLLLACKRVITLQTLVYGMEHLLFNN